MAETISRQVFHIHDSPQTLFLDREVQPEDLQNLWFRGNHGFEVWLKEALMFRRDPMEIVRAGLARGESMWKHITDGFEFLGDLDNGDRASNGLRLALETPYNEDGSVNEYGDLQHRALNNPALSDHNHEHSRRDERLIESFVLNIGELRHSASIKEWIDALMLQPYWHDVDQLLTLQRNRDESMRLPAKRGHAIAAAVMLLAVHTMYGQERVVRTRDAWRTCAAAAYMALKHDEPEHLMDALSRTYTDENGKKRPKVLAYALDGSGTRHLVHGSELRTLFDSNRLDLTSIAPSQLIELLKMVKSEHGYMDDGKSVYGLHPFFEKKFFAELQNLANNNDPLFRDIDDKEIETLNLATEVAVRADMIDMVEPPVESMLRMFLAQISRDRPIWRNKSSVDELFQLIVAGDGNVDSSVDSDVRRILWEFVHIDHVSRDSVIAKNAYMRKVNRENALLGVLSFRRYGLSIMRGDFSFIADSYAKRILEVTDKALSKSGVGFFDRHAIIRRAIVQKDFHGVVNFLHDKGLHDLALRYKNKIDTLVATEQELTRLLQKKHTERQAVLSQLELDQEIVAFISLCDRVTEELCIQHKVNRRQLNTYKKRVAKGNITPSVQPYRYYDSLGSPDHIRTIIPPKRQA